LLTGCIWPGFAVYTDHRSSTIPKQKRREVQG
jgi:hypothetical protein